MGRATVTISIWQKPIVYKISWHCFLIAVTLMCWAVCPDCPLFNLTEDRGNINAEAYTATLRLTCRFYFVIFNVTELEHIFLHADMRWCCHLPYIPSSMESCMAGCVLQCCPAGLSLWVFLLLVLSGLACRRVDWVEGTAAQLRFHRE